MAKVLTLDDLLRELSFIHKQMRDNEEHPTILPEERDQLQESWRLLAHVLLLGFIRREMDKDRELRDTLWMQAETSRRAERVE